MGLEKETAPHQDKMSWKQDAEADGPSLRLFNFPNLTLMLPIENRLRNKEDFDQAYRYGKSLFCDKIVLRVRKNDLPVMRMGISIGAKHFKKAVARNRLKRQIRAFFRKNLEKIRIGIDIVVILQKGWNEKDSPVSIIEKLLAKNSLYN